MNLHGIVANAVGAVNPMIFATVKKSTGYTTSPDGTQVATYETTSGWVQMQGLVEREFAVLMQSEDMNMSAINRKLYAYGSLNMIVRTLGLGGDLIEIGISPDVTTWKLVRIWETWPDWCAVVIRQQLDTP